MTFVPKQNFDKNDSITLYVAAKDFTGRPINGTAVLTKIKMSFGGYLQQAPSMIFRRYGMLTMSMSLSMTVKADKNK